MKAAIFLNLFASANGDGHPYPHGPDDLSGCHPNSGQYWKVIDIRGGDPSDKLGCAFQIPFTQTSKWKKDIYDAAMGSGMDKGWGDGTGGGSGYGRQKAHFAIYCGSSETTKKAKEFLAEVTGDELWEKEPFVCITDLGGMATGQKDTIMASCDNIVTNTKNSAKNLPAGYTPTAAKPPADAKETPTTAPATTGGGGRDYGSSSSAGGYVSLGLTAIAGMVFFQ